MREIAECAAQLVRRFRHVASVETDRSAGGARYRREHAHERRFSSAVGAEQPENPGLEPQREITYGVDGSVAFVQSIDLQFHRRIYAFRRGVVSGMMRGELCRLRRYRSGDASALCAVANDFEVVGSMTRRFPHPYTLRDAEELIAMAMSAPRGQILAIEVDGAIAGGIGVEPHEGERTGTALFGYWLGRACWGRGIATEAARMLSNFALQSDGLRRLEATVFAPNTASARVLTKCGFAFEG